MSAQALAATDRIAEMETHAAANNGISEALGIRRFEGFTWSGTSTEADINFVHDETFNIVDGMIRPISLEGQMDDFQTDIFP